MKKEIWLIVGFVFVWVKSWTQVSQPNILWIVMEDTSPHFIGAYGNKNAKTPNIDRLAAQGIKLENAFSTGTVCSPSRFTLITGLRSFESGTGNHRTQIPLPESIKGFPFYLRGLGYYTANNKKTDYNTSSAMRLEKESWNESSATAGWNGRKPGQPFFAVFNFEASHQSRTMTKPFRFYEQEVLNELPSHLLTHDSEIEVPPYFKDSPEMRKQLGRIYNSISLADFQIGRLLDRLQKDQLMDSTIIFFYADHGEGMPRAKTNGLDIGYRVPFVIWIPEMYRQSFPIPKGQTLADLVSFEDLAPTTISLAGGQIPDYMKGRVFLGNEASRPDSLLLLSNDGAEGVSETSRTITDGQFSYTRIFSSYMPELWFKKYHDYSEVLSLMRQDLKAGVLNKDQAIPFQPRDPEYLFDYKNDPWQMHNLIHDPKYKNLVESRRKALKDSLINRRDVMFLSDYELNQISLRHATPYYFRTNDSVYPIEAIYEAASLAGFKDAKTLTRQMGLLSHPSPYVRYWAALGLKSHGASIRAYKDVIKKGLKDVYPPVQIILASVCYDWFENGQAKTLLDSAILSQNVYLSRWAIQMIQYQSRQKPFVATINVLLSEMEKHKISSGAKEVAETFLYSVEGRPLTYPTF